MSRPLLLDLLPNRSEVVPSKHTDALPLLQCPMFNTNPPPPPSATLLSMADPPQEPSLMLLGLENTRKSERTYPRNQFLYGNVQCHQVVLNYATAYFVREQRVIEEKATKSVDGWWRCVYEWDLGATAEHIGQFSSDPPNDTSVLQIPSKRRLTKDPQRRSKRLCGDPLESSDSPQGDTQTIEPPSSITT